MSGFSADWLALREPADHRARNRDLLARLRDAFAGRETIEVVDLGCGTGSNLRACAAFLPPRQHWRLVDHDPKLLAAARARLSGWADRSEAAGDRLKVVSGGCEIEIAFVEGDLSHGVENVLKENPDLVTAAALFDLVSPAWIERFARLVAARNAVFYTALTYDGTEVWRPPHPADADIFAAFQAHQRGDKGFGPSAGPGAGPALAAAFAALGYRVESAISPWDLGPGDTALIRELAQGVAQAAEETGRLAGERIAAWRSTRLAGAACAIGHTDLLALPQS